MTKPHNLIHELNVPVPMRDGTVLRADIFRPEGAGRCPALLVRTPYDKSLQGSCDRFVRAGYAVMAQDMRGRYASDGEFVPFFVPTPMEGDDGYDTVEWLAGRPWCDGRVGTMGSSYNGWTQWMLARRRPPHLKAMAAQAIPLEASAMDYTGAFRPGRRIFWLMASMSPDLRRRAGGAKPHRPEEAIRLWRELEHSHIMGMLPWSELLPLLPAALARPFGRWLQNPADPVWRFDQAHHEIEVPNFDLTGWWDHCSSIAHLEGMRKNARTAEARSGSQLVIGPWNHSQQGVRRVGGFDFGPSAEVDLVDLHIRWFDHWLKGLDNGVGDDPPVRYFVLGSNTWKSSESWPPPNRGEVHFYLRGGGGLTLEVPDAPTDQTPDTYNYDPRDPVPTLWDRDVLYTVPADRRRLEHRGDILRYVTLPLAADLEIAGNPQVLLYAASSAPDTDFFASLSDQSPDGACLEVSSGMVRARHRNGLDRRDGLTPGEVTVFRIRLNPIACRFIQGHRIRLEITSSDFPNFDRNHNTGRNDLFDAGLAIARQTLHHSTRHPSRLELPGIFLETN